jgi:CheY-like chemotaxis protein
MQTTARADGDKIKTDKECGMSRTVLIVDDAPAMCRMLSHQLNFHGYNAPFALSARDALQLLAADPLPDLIVMDIMMPEVDGFALLHTLRGDSRTAHLPVIMCSATSDSESMATALANGASAYWAKDKIDFERMGVDIEQLIGGEPKNSPPTAV